MTNNAIDLEKLKNALLKDDAATRLESGSPWTCPEYRAIVNAARAEINEVTIANIDSTSFSGSITLEEEYD
jgi:hypothetical protein